METYGVTVRQLREKRGYLMKEVYEGVVGRATAFRFERGQTAIATTKLRRILAAIGFSSMDEFFYYHDQQVGETFFHLEKELSQRMKSAGYRIQSDKREAVWAFYVEHRESSKKDVRFLAYAAHFDFLTNGAQEPAMDWQKRLAPFAEEWAFISQYLVQIETWSLRELDWFAFLSSCFTPELRALLRKKYQKNMIALRAYDEDWTQHYYHNLLNYEMNSVAIGDTQTVSQNLVEIERAFETDQTLQWEMMQRCRILFLQIVMAGIENRPDDLRDYYQRLEQKKSFFTGENELLTFYLTQSLALIRQYGSHPDREQWLQKLK